MFTLRDIIDIAVRIERNGEKIYRDASRRVDDEALSALFEWLADQELQHVSWFSELGELAPESLDDDSPLAAMGREMLENVVGDSCFTLDDVDLTKLESLTEVIETAIEAEQDTVIFYNMLAGFVGDEATLKHLRTIIGEELRHAESLSEFLATGRASAPPLL